MIRTASAGRWARLLPALLLLGALACESPTQDPPLEESGAEGIRILAPSGAVLASVSLGRVDGELSVEAGETTPRLDVVFTDRNGTPLSLPSGSFSFRVVSADRSIAEWVESRPDEFTGRVRGNAPGRTTLAFHLVRGSGGEGLSDWISPGIDTRVEQ